MTINLLLSRLISALLVIFGVICLVFLLLHMVPGDPVEVMLGESARPADRAALRLALGLDRPILEQLFSYLNGLLHFDLGQSLHSRQPITELLMQRLPATLELTGAALAIAVITALPLGVMAALYQGKKQDSGAMLFSLLGISIPNFWLGPMLILLFSLWLGWTPVSGRDAPGALILPAITLGTALAAILARMVRSTLLEVLHEDYIRTAQAKGLARSQVIWRHALGNAWLPIITLLGLQLGALLDGAVITETIFDWPGLGSLLVESIQKRDYPAVQGCVLLISVTYVVVNMLTDLLYSWVDPRIRIGET
ncbi:MAG: ABC transporter permease [Candidatus Polarisedimenticolaceae bacterium]|nr:ABC transporter permease [Candidatus Polarisedimenticolaceae bacterium]